MVEARRQIERAEFESISKRLVARAEGGRGRVRRIPSADADDVVQDAWEKTVRQKREFPEGDELEAHVHQALVDTASDYWRTRRLNRKVPPEALTYLDTTIEECVPAKENTEERALAELRAREIRAALRQELDALTERYAILDALDLTEKEIADRLGIGLREVDAIRKRFNRSRGALAEAVDYSPQKRRREIT